MSHLQAINRTIFIHKMTVPILGSQRLTCYLHIYKKVIIVDGRVVISERSLNKRFGMIWVPVFQESVQYHALKDMRVKIAYPLRAGHSFSDVLMRW
jgi:hypothetical protein